jgi:uncharacterized protein with HEPN domain
VTCSIVRGYGVVKHDEVWRTVQEHVPELIARLDALLGDRS